MRDVGPGAVPGVDDRVRGWLAGQVDALEAEAALVSWRSADGEALEARWWTGFDDATVAAFARQDLDLPTPATDCLLACAPVTVDAVADLPLRYAGLLPGLPTPVPADRPDRRALAVVPVLESPGRAGGVLVVLFAGADRMHPMAAALHAAAAQLWTRLRSWREEPGAAAGRAAGPEPAAEPAATPAAVTPAAVTPAARALAHLSVQLLSAGTPTEVVDRVAEHASAALGATWAGMQLLDPDGRSVRMVPTSHTPPEIVARYRVETVDGPLPGHLSLREDRVVLVRSRPERDATFPVLRELMPDLVSLACLPVRGLGRTLAMVGFGFDTRQHFADDQLEELQQVAGMCASALERIARPPAPPRPDPVGPSPAGRSRLESVAEEVAQAQDTPALARDLVTSASEALGAGCAAVALFDEDTSSFTGLASSGESAEVLLPEGSSAGDRRLTRDLASTAEPILIGWRADFDARYPGTRAAGSALQAWAYLPLVTAGRLIGTVAFGWSRARTFTAAERRHLVTLARHTTAVLDRSRLLTSYAAAAETLQRAFLPELHTVAGWEVAGHYRPAFQGTHVGGDWYDVFPLADDRVGLVVGDVAGKGLRAAAVMGAVRSALRAYARLTASPAQVLTHLDDYMAQYKAEEMLTCCLAVLDPGSGHLVYSRAGHPPPLVVNSGVAGYWLEDALGPPLGTNHQAQPRRDAAVDLSRMGPDATLLLYSDGVIERRRGTWTDGRHALVTAAAALTAPVDLDLGLAALTLDLQHPDMDIDDQAILVLRQRRG